MRKIFLVLMVALMMALPLSQVTFAQGDPATLGANWLMSQQAENGSFNDDVAATALTIIALSSVGEDTGAALDWMETTIVEGEDGSLDNMDTLSVAVLAVVAGGRDLETFAEGKLLELYNGNLRQQRGESVTDLCFGLLALPSTGAPMPPTAIGGLLSLQNEDGGFGNAEEEPTGDQATAEASDALATGSTVEDTALCAQVLVAAEETEALAKALDYLKNKQNPDGGWSLSFMEAPEVSDPFSLGIVLQALLAAGEDLADWGNPEMVLFSFMDLETGEVNFEDDPSFSVIVTALAVQVFRGVTWIGIGAPAEGETGPGEDTSAPAEGPALDAQWEVVAQGFGMAELNSADDLLVTVVDPFTGDELYGVQIINWVAEYQYTGYLVQSYLAADVLLWLGEQDPTTWENISEATLKLLPADVLSQLPEEVQAMIAN